MTFSLPIYTLSVIFTFLIDRISKLVAMHWCNAQPLIINSYISGELSFNRGIASGLFHSSHDYVFYAVSVFVLMFTLLFGYYTYEQYKKDINILGYLFVFVGSCCNLIDRFVYGGVIDFIVLSYNGYSWPVFNVADAAICIGVAIIVISELFPKQMHKNTYAN